MTRMLLFAFSLGYSLSSLAQQAQTSGQRSLEQEAVHKAVDEIVAAIDRNDADALDRLSTADYTFVNPAGKVWNKAQ